MANLIKKHKDEKEQKRQERYFSCLDLTKRMKQIVKNQEDKNGAINITRRFGSGYPEKFNTECPELRGFIDGVNNNPESKIQIGISKSYNNNITRIVTTVDTDNEMVRYYLF
jgi:hypothetical protein